MISTEGGDVGIGVVVQVEDGEVAVAETVHEDVDQPLPRRGDFRGSHWREVVLLLLGIKDVALLVLTEAQCQTDLIGGRLVNEGLDDEGTCEMDEGVAGRLERVVEQLAEVLVDKVGHCQPVVTDVVLHNTQHDHADRAFVLEPTVLPLLPWKFLEVRVRAVLLHLPHFPHHRLEVLLPVAAPGQAHDLPQGLLAVDCLDDLRGVLDDLQVLVEHLDCNVDLHGDGEGSASVALLMRLHHLLQFRLAVLQQGWPMGVKGTRGDHQEQQECTNGSHLIGFITELIIGNILVEGDEWTQRGGGEFFWCYQQFEMEEASKQQANPLQLSAQKQDEQSIQKPPPSSHPVQEKESSPSLRAQLLAMQFDPSLVDRVVQQTDDLQKAMELIVSQLEEQDIQEACSGEEVQMVLLVRMDLKMGLGKIAAQCAHATLKAYQQARSRAQSEDHYSLTFIQWLEGGQQKLAYQVPDQQTLFESLKKFEAMGVGTCYIRDAGRTQIAAGSATVGGVGPWGAKKLEAVTRALRRL